MRATLVMVTVTVVTASCGTQSAPAMGDVDRPLSFVGPFQTLTAGESPHGSSELFGAPDTRTTIDEPSVIVVEDERLVFVSMIQQDGTITIGRAVEQAPHTLTFGAPAAVFTPTMPWEGSSVGSPGVAVGDQGAVLLAYAAQGAIGLATSTDGGTTFQHRAAPILSPAAGQTFAQPSLARSQDGTWSLAYQSNGSLFVVHAPAPEGPWTPASAPVLQPSPADTDGGLAFDGVALGDPGITVLTTAANRPLFVLFYTATGSGMYSTVGVAASFDGASFTRLPRAVYSERSAPVRAGNLDVVDANTAFLWVADQAPGSRAISAALGPIRARNLLGGN